MKLLKLWLLLLFVVPLFTFAQRNVNAIIDTVETPNGAVILYKNFTWEYLQDEPILMTQDEDSTGLFSTQWINNQIFAYRMNVDSIHDTLIRVFAGINYGPWERLNGNRSFIKGFGDKPAGANLYPLDMTKEEFEKWENKDKTSQYSVIGRNADHSLKKSENFPGQLFT